MSLRPKKTKSKNASSIYGIHQRKFGGKLFKSYGLGGFFVSNEAAEILAKAEREWGSEARVAKVEGGYRVFLRDKKRG